MPANSTPLLKTGRIAAADLPAYCPVGPDGSAAAYGAPILGITEASAKSGSRVSVVVSGSTEAWAGAVIPDGALLQVGPNNTVVPAANGAVIGRALNGANAGDKVEVLLSAAAGYDTADNQAAYPGRFVRLANSPIYSTASEKAGFDLGAVLWPWVFPAYKYIANPLAKYYLYYSTDHATWGGIGLALSDSPTGPFVQYTPPGPSTQDPNCPGTYTNGHPNQAGAIYMDAQVGATSGNVVWGTPGAVPVAGTINYMQCETPSVIWDEEAGLLRMFYQVGSTNGRAVWSNPADPTATPALYETFYSSTGAQSTCCAVSTDGINWTKDRNFIIHPIWQSHTPGDGHSGYFMPSLVNGQWMAYHLWGSTNYARMAMSRAAGPGATNWATDNRELGPWGHVCGKSSGGKDMQINWNNTSVIDGARGPIAIGTIGEYASGVATREMYLFAAPLSADLRKVTAYPKKFSFVSGALPWESTDIKGASVLQDEGRVYVYYSCKVGAAYNVGVMEYV